MDSASTVSAPDLFDAESRALIAARTIHSAGPGAEPATSHQALGELLTAYERLLRETRRLVRRSDRAEFEMSQMNQRLQDLAAELEYRATHDPLTGVLNRAAIIERVNLSFSTNDVALIVLDIDYFKRVNDNFGHPVGDRVILGVVACLKKVVPVAHIGRVGGEEFTILLLEQEGCAERIAEAARREIEAYAFELPDSSLITASFGVSWLPRGSSFDVAYGLADEALYAAKRGGRNRVVRVTSQAPAEI
jgi:diguanylate cyclase